MSKDPVSKDADLKEDDPVKLPRRRKGGLRVPEDNVPRPTTASPRPEEPRGAVSMAYAYDEHRAQMEDALAQLDERDTRDTIRGIGDLALRAPGSTLPPAHDGEPLDPRVILPGPDEITTADLPILEEAEAVEIDTPRPDSVDVPLDDALDGEEDSAPPAPIAAASPGPAAAAVDDAVPQRIPRASTVALSEADLEEFDDGDPSYDLARAEVRARLARLRAGRDTDADEADEGEPTGPNPMLGAIEDDAVDAQWDAGSASEPAVIMPIAAPAPTVVADDDDDEPVDIELRADDREPVIAPAVDEAHNRRLATEPPPPPIKQANGAAPAAAVKPKPPPAPVAARAAAVAAAAADVRESRRPRRRGKPWFEEIFDEDYLRTLPFLTPQATQLEANYVMEALAIDPGSQVLDIGCGYGRHAMELAARGYHVVGLDSSLPLLLRGADEAQRRGLSINFVHGDMREINFDSQFDGAYCLFSTFGYFDDETNKKTAQNIARALKPGARCVVEVLNRDYVVADLPSRVWWEGDGCVVLEEVDFNYFSSRVVSNRSVVFDDGRQLEQEISIRSFSLHELGKLLHTAGFRVVEVSGSMLTRGRFFGAHSRDIVIVAERRVEKT